MSHRTAASSPVEGMLRGVVLTGCLGTLVLATAAWALVGEKAGYSALAGALAAFAVILLGVIGMSFIIRGSAGLTLPGAFVVYVGQLILLVGVLLVVRGQEWLDGPAFAVCAIVQTVLLQIGQISGYARARHPLYPQEEAR